MCYPRRFRPISAFAAAMRALGRDDPPTSFMLGGVAYRRTRIVKHDFWAATAFYECSEGRQVVAKINRREPFCGFPLGLIGEILNRREIRFYAALGDLGHVPAVLGRIGKTGFVHEFVPGEPLNMRRPVSPDFFPELRRLVDEIHRRNIAYVDANKPQNILHGADGQPYLIDFQISFDLNVFGDWFLPRLLLRRLQDADDYHILKHRRKFRPQEMSRDEIAESRRQNHYIRVHRMLSWPYFWTRRRLLRRWREEGKLLPEGSK